MPGVLEAAGLAAWQGSAGQGANVPQAVAVVPTRRWCSRPGVLKAAGLAGWQGSAGQGANVPKAVAQNISQNFIPK